MGRWVCRFVVTNLFLLKLFPEECLFLVKRGEAVDLVLVCTGDFDVVRALLVPRELDGRQGSVSICNCALFD